jgi:hypothetical protein
MCRFLKKTLFFKKSKTQKKQEGHQFLMLDSFLFSCACDSSNNVGVVWGSWLTALHQRYNAVWSHLNSVYASKIVTRTQIAVGPRNNRDLVSVLTRACKRDKE